MRKSFVAVFFSFAAVISLFAQEGCAAPTASEGQSVPAMGMETSPVPLMPLVAEDTLWKLVLLSSRWDYDPVTRRATASGIIFNAGAERIRGAGLQVALRDGAGCVIATEWKTGKNVYLEAGAYDAIALEISLPPGPEPATATFETIAVTGSCGW